MTPQEYLAFERASETKHEYVDGEIFAMSGGTREHSLVGTSVRMTPQEYLAFERTSETKHEYIDGEIFAMSGGTFEHSLLAQNIARELGNALFDRPCTVHGSDLKVKVAPLERYFYPDALVVRGQAILEGEARDLLLNPRVIVEVLSESSEGNDRGEKFASYQAIESLQEYVLLSQTEVRVEHYSRQRDGSWIYRSIGAGGELALPSIECVIAVDRVYAKVFPAKGA